MAQESRLGWALALSLLLHMLLLTLLPFIRRAQLALPQPPALLDIDVLPMPQPKPAPPPPAPAAPAPPAAAPAQAQPAQPPPPQIPVPKNQIVSPPDAGEEKVPENAHLLSDRNNTVKEETIKRGEPLPGDPDARPQAPDKVAKAEKPQPQPKAQPKAQPKPQPPPPPVAEEARPKPNPGALPKLDQLLPTAGDLMHEGAGAPEKPAAAPAAQQEASIKRDDLLRHGDPWHTGSLRPGSMDFLPAVREGDITMLNTKAEQFAPFVRRVAMRVFENFWMTLRRSVDARFAESVKEYAIVEAVMDKHGKLLNVSLKDRSGTVSAATDRNLQNACREGFFDRNPPSGAEANDGNIHFIFQAQVQLVVDPRSGGAAGGALMSAGLL